MQRIAEAAPVGVTPRGPAREPFDGTAQVWIAAMRCEPPSDSFGICGRRDVVGSAVVREIAPRICDNTLDHVAVPFQCDAALFVEKSAGHRVTRTD